MCRPWPRMRRSVCRQMKCSILPYVVSMVVVSALSVLATLLAAGQLKDNVNFGKKARPSAALTAPTAASSLLRPGLGLATTAPPANRHRPDRRRARLVKPASTQQAKLQPSIGRHPAPPKQTLPGVFQGSGQRRETAGQGRDGLAVRKVHRGNGVKFLVVPTIEPFYTMRADRRNCLVCMKMDNVSWGAPGDFSLSLSLSLYISIYTHISI